jgi:hypothetical protein
MIRASTAVRSSLLAIALVMSSAAGAGPAEDAEAAFLKFFPAFVAHNQVQVAAMFAADGQFYGTLSPQLVTTPEAVNAYFAATLNRPDVVVATPLQLSTKALAEGVVLIAGSWKFDRTLSGTTTVAGPFRVTAVMQKRNDAWHVVQFHNSPVPTPPAP